MSFGDFGALLAELDWRSILAWAKRDNALRVQQRRYALSDGAPPSALVLVAGQTGRCPCHCAPPRLSRTLTQSATGDGEKGAGGGGLRGGRQEIGRR